MARATVPLGPFCHSCATLMSKPEDFGTDASGNRQNDFCSACYSHGEFAAPQPTMQDLLDLSMSLMVQENVTEQPVAQR